MLRSSRKCDWFVWTYFWNFVQRNWSCEYWIFFKIHSSGEPARYPENYLKGQKGEQGFDGSPGAHGQTGDIGPRGMATSCY